MSSSARNNVLIVYIVHEATPKAPARAVSTAMRILRIETHPFPPSMEGNTESVKEFLVVIWFEFISS